MRARTRLVLDATLLIALIAAFRPTWTGVSLHQWLSIAIIAPLLLHVIVNWEWTIRVIRTFVQHLLSMSRLNLVIDCALFLSAVCVILSGFMVSPALLTPLGIHPAQPLVWHFVHVWSANATIALLAIHAAAHWRWAYRTATRIVGKSTQRIGTAAASASRLVARSHKEESPDARPARGTSRVGVRAAQAAKERAVAVRTMSVMGVTAVVGLSIFAGVGLASAVLPAPRQANTRVAKAGLMVCPSTGCTASRCHAQYGKSAKVFYASTQAKSSVRRKLARVASPARLRRATAVRPATPRPAKTPRAVAPQLAHRVVRRVVKKVVMTCPRTGCTASSCHGTHGQSAATYYKNH